jgi:Polyketide cyclase / dehydrase and lipid transport
MIEPSFRWPDGFRPEQAALYVRNVRRIEQPAVAVWDALVRAPHWPVWYRNASRVRLPNGAHELALGMRFRWTQTGIPLDCEIREFEPTARIAWFARSPLIQAYHAWDIQVDGDACLVVTDETQRGFLPRLFGPLLKPRMLTIHDRWLACLETESAPTHRRAAFPFAG